MGKIHDIAKWRVRRIARNDIPIGGPSFVLEEPCPGCGQQRVATMVWRSPSDDALPTPLPRMSPHFLCCDGEVVSQEITDAGIPLTEWAQILGHFERADSETG